MRRLAALLLLAAMANAGTDEIRRGLSADSRGARAEAEAAARRLARTDPAGLAGLWDSLDERGRCGLMRALASAGTKHAAVVALKRAGAARPEVFRAMLEGMAEGGAAALSAPVPETLPAARRRAVEWLRTRWRVEAELAALKSMSGSTGQFTGQFAKLKPLGPAAIAILFDIVMDRGVALPGEASAGRFEAIHPELVRYERYELREVAANAFGEITPRDDRATIERLLALFDYYWSLDDEQYEFEKYGLAPNLAYSLWDLARLGGADERTAQRMTTPASRYISDLERTARGGFGYEALQARWNLGYAHIRIGNYAIGERHYKEILRIRGMGVSRHVAAYNLACNFSKRAQAEPRQRERFKRYAIEYLRRAVYELNWWDWGWMEEDGDLDFIRTMPEYKAILKHLKAKYPDRKKGKVSKKARDFLGGGR
ncbi:MAG: hypothetical protein ACYTGN_16060 [Planctomycetota bacterium]|jgi:hypothetical protein